MLRVLNTGSMFNFGQCEIQSVDWGSNADCRYII